MSCTDEFWLNNIQNLFCSFSFVPSPDETYEEQLNAMSRGVLLLWMTLYAMRYKHHSIVPFFLLFIIILYYSQRMTMKENYCPPNTITLEQWKQLPRGNKLKTINPSSYRFCQDQREIQFNQNYFSTNQATVPPANPKTLEPVYVIAPPSAWDYWSEDYVIPSAINDYSTFDLTRSGYMVTNSCGKTDGLMIYPTEMPMDRKVERNPPVLEGYSGGIGGCRFDECSIEGYTGLYPSPNLRQDPSQQHHTQIPKSPGDLVGCAYDPKQMLDHNIPSNLPVGMCQKNDAFNEYNKNMFTQVIQPGMYSRVEVTEPIQSNMGITTTLQFEPVTCEKAEDGGTVYVTHDPRITPPNIQSVPIPVEPNNSNIYDPRSNGYGTSYRSYIDTMTQQPRFYYDDIDAVRRPNYISRSNIDDAPWANSYGPMSTEKANGAVPNQFSHALAQNKFLHDSLQQRGDLQERWMHKYNTEIGWQRRQAPIRTSGVSNTAKR